MASSSSASMNISKEISVPDRIIDIKGLKRSRFDETDSYQELRVLGYGGNGNCYLLKRRSDQALRVCKVTYRFHEKEPREATILLKILPRHPRILNLHDVIIHARTFQLYFDYYSGGDLSDLIKDYNERQTLIPEPLLWNCFRQLAEALNFIHYGFDERSDYGMQPTWISVIHGDIKPENVFLRFPNGTTSHTLQNYPFLVLGDFGSASLYPLRRVGTYIWQPPEIPMTSKGADVWATGAVIHAMAHNGDAPIAPLPDYIESTHQNWLEWYQSPEARVPIPLYRYYSKRLHDCVFDALDLNPRTRCSSLELSLRIPWPLDSPTGRVVFSRVNAGQGRGAQEYTVDVTLRSRRGLWQPQS